MDAALERLTVRMEPLSDRRQTARTATSCPARSSRASCTLPLGADRATGRADRSYVSVRTNVSRDVRNGRLSSLPLCAKGLGVSMTGQFMAASANGGSANGGYVSTGLIVAGLVILLVVVLGLWAIVRSRFSPQSRNSNQRRHT